RFAQGSAPASPSSRRSASTTRASPCRTESYFFAKTAVTVSERESTRLQRGFFPVQPPDHRVKRDPRAAAAVRASALPTGSVALQRVPHFPPAPETVPLPAPALRTVSFAVTTAVVVGGGGGGGCAVTFTVIGSVRTRPKFEPWTVTVYWPVAVLADAV